MSARRERCGRRGSTPPSDRHSLPALLSGLPDVGRPTRWTASSVDPRTHWKRADVAIKGKSGPSRAGRRERSPRLHATLPSRLRTSRTDCTRPDPRRIDSTPPPVTALPIPRPGTSRRRVAIRLGTRRSPGPGNFADNDGLQCASDGGEPGVASRVVPATTTRREARLLGFYPRAVDCSMSEASESSVHRLHEVVVEPRLARRWCLSPIPHRRYDSRSRSGPIDVTRPVGVGAAAGHGADPGPYIISEAPADRVRVGVVSVSECPESCRRCPMNVRQYLDQSRKHYDVLMHLETHSAMGMARAIHIPGDEVAKPVILKADGHYVMAVIPATYRIDLDKAREAFHVRRWNWPPRRTSAVCSPIATRSPAALRLAVWHADGGGRGPHPRRTDRLRGEQPPRGVPHELRGIR